MRVTLPNGMRGLTTRAKRHFWRTTNFMKTCPVCGYPELDAVGRSINCACPLSACSPKAERSEAVPRCPPSATGCPDARAVGQAGAVSSGRCPEESDLAALVKTAMTWRRREKLWALIFIGAKDGDAEREAAIAEKHLKELRIIVDRMQAASAPQRSGERALPGNEKLRDRTPKA